jgi:hypothetical protein
MAMMDACVPGVVTAANAALLARSEVRSTALNTATGRSRGEATGFDMMIFSFDFAVVQMAEGHSLRIPANQETLRLQEVSSIAHAPCV